MLPVPQCPGEHVESFSLAVIRRVALSDGPLFGSIAYVILLRSSIFQLTWNSSGSARQFSNFKLFDFVWQSGLRCSLTNPPSTFLGACLHH